MKIVTNYPTCSPHELELPSSLRKWNVPNSVQLQDAKTTHAHKAFLQRVLLQVAVKNELLTAQLAAAQQQSEQCGVRRVAVKESTTQLLVCMQPRPQMSSSDLGVPQRAGAINVVDHSRLSVLQPWPSSRHPSLSSLCASAS